MSTRREFLQGVAASGLLLAVEWPAEAATKPALVAGWIRIAPDGAVTILSNTSEIGQGTGTGIAQLVGDELDVSWEQIRLEMAPVEKAYFNPGFGEYATYGSGGIAQQEQALRLAGARARAMLIEAAARRWKVAAADCRTKGGFVIGPSGRKLGYGALAVQAAAIAPPEKPPLKARNDWNFIGKPMQRLDLPAKVNGTALYGIDVKLPGLLVATIAQCPAFAGTLASVDAAPALAIPGVKRVIELESAVAVVATGYWPARKGLLALQPKWDLSKASRADSRSYSEQLRKGCAGEGLPYAQQGTTAAALAEAHEAAMAKAVRRMEAVYEVPFVAHATMEPMNATARLRDGGVELWLPTQNQSATRDSVAARLGISADKVTIHTTLAGGGFGRRAEVDFAVQAAQIAKAARAPVKLIWSREEDLQHDYYRPAAAVRMIAGLDDAGAPVAWRVETACESLLDWSLFGKYKRADGVVDTTSLMGFARPAYDLGAPRYGWTKIDVGVPVAFWRSVGASQNIFALESFVDELALAANADPLAYRLRLLRSGSRARKVLEAAVDAAGWSKPVPGRYRGIALAPANGSVVAQIAEVSVEADKVKVHRVTCAVDCGLAVNPNCVAAQMEGGIAFGLSTAFLGEITLAAGRVEQSNFDGFPLISLAQMPEIQVVPVDTGEKAGGTGEEAVAPLAPAVANAIFAATGRRLRTLPLAHHGLTLV
ncbi:MAG TPA: molybdopterin cofactor-binding domain-containing protein [Myxococcales bacterium]|nr:molybdopterin cofactor-binding domain-containing protein [Myxococcales bacterium]